MSNNEGNVAAIILAAGMSQRMGVPKMTLPWRRSTVLGAVVTIIHDAGVMHIRVVTGGSRKLVEHILDEMPYAVERDFNPAYANGEMLDSIKIGLSNLGARVSAALLALGDQPQIEVKVVSTIIGRYFDTGNQVIVPSYQMRRGHPWLIGRSLWREILGMTYGQSMRDFFARHAAEIDYLNVDTPSVLQDLDTPEDYQKAVKN